MKDSKRSLAAGVSVSALAVLLCSCGGSAPDEPMAMKTERPFAAAGSIEMQLEGGSYEIKPASGDVIRISFGGNTGNATADVTTTGTHANVSVKDTPHNNFKAAIEVPQTSDLVIHLSGGQIEMGAIAGNKDIDSKAGNVGIVVGNAGDYSSVDASVTAGNLDGGPFGKSDSGISNHLKWTGNGKYTLRVNLGAGNLELKSH